MLCFYVTDWVWGLRSVNRPLLDDGILEGKNKGKAPDAIGDT